MKKIKVAVKIDQQVGFVTGNLANPGAQARIPYLVEKARRQARDGYVFVGTKDTHSANPEEYLATSEGQHLPIWHCGLGTADHEIVPELRDLYDQLGIQYVNKPTFGSLELPQVLRALEADRPGRITEIELDGFVSEICVVSNALLLKASFSEVRVVVDSQGCAGLDHAGHQAALAVLRACQVEVI